MKYNEHTTYALYTKGLETPEELQRALMGHLGISLEDRGVGMMRLEIDHETILDWNDGFVITGTRCNAWDGTGSSCVLHIGEDTFNDGHLQNICPDIIRIDLTKPYGISPRTYIKQHTMIWT